MKKIIFIFAIFLAVLAVPKISLATEYYVSTNGNDSNPGTETQPWRTIQHAADVVNPGDIVIVKPGSYERVKISRSGSAGNKIIFKGFSVPDKSLMNQGLIYNPLNPTAIPSNPSANAVTKGFSISASYVRIENFEVTQIYDPAVSFLGRGAIFINGTQSSSVSNIEIVGNFIHDPNAQPGSYNYMGIRSDNHYNSAILISGNTLYHVQGTGIIIMGNNWVVENNELSHGLDTNSDTGTVVGGDSDAFRFFGNGHIIRNNYAHDYLDNEQAGAPHIDCFQTFSVYPDTQFANNVLVEKNFCKNMGQMLMSEDQSEMNGGINAVHHITFRNNIFKGARAVSIIVSRCNDYFTFENNVVTEGYYNAISISGTSTHATVLNNIFYNNYESDPNNRRGQMLTETASKVGAIWDYNIHYPDFTWPIKQSEYDIHGMFGIDPKFINPVADDYRLSLNSPAINAGISIADFNDDKNGISRPQGSAWDTGAYEYVSATDTTPPLAPSGVVVN